MVLPLSFSRPFAGPTDRQVPLGTDQLLTNAQGESRISVEDYAMAMVDEVEKPKHVRRRFTVGY